MLIEFDNLLKDANWTALLMSYWSGSGLILELPLYQLLMRRVKKAISDQIHVSPVPQPTLHYRPQNGRA